MPLLKQSSNITDANLSAASPLYSAPALIKIKTVQGLSSIRVEAWEGFMARHSGQSGGLAYAMQRT